MQTDAPVIQDPTDIEENLHLLIDQSFYRWWTIIITFAEL